MTGFLVRDAVRDGDNGSAGPITMRTGFLSERGGTAGAVVGPPTGDPTRGGYPVRPVRCAIHGMTWARPVPAVIQSWELPGFCQNCAAIPAAAAAAAMSR